MRRALAFFFVLCAAVLLLLKGTVDRNIVRADGCNASATAKASQTNGNQYSISSDVTSGDCVKLQCRGFVHYLISYHVPSDGTKGQARDLNDFRIDPGGQKTHIALEYSLSGIGAVIDGVKVESVSCLTTAP